MSLFELNWGIFTLLTLAILGTRLIVCLFLPLDFLAITTPITLGFITFLGVGVLGYSDLIWISATEFAFYVWCAYTSCMFGAALVGSRRRVRVTIARMARPSQRLANWALLICAVYVGFELVSFFLDGGFAQARDMILGGFAHLERVVKIGRRAVDYQGQSLSDILRTAGNYAFVCFWVVAFIGRPRASLFLFTLHVVAQMASYLSRSSLFSMLVLPYLAYLAFYPPSRRQLLMQVAVLGAVILVFFSWNAAVRIGETYELSLDQVVADTVRDAGNSVIPASQILTSELRGSGSDYIISMLTFLIPRSIWPTKPALLYNYEISYLVTGYRVGEGTSVVTSTMLGEAWYYFGWAGTILLMLMFGATAQFLERFLVQVPLTMGLYFTAWYGSMIQIRSTYLTYYQMAIILAVFGAFFLWLYRQMTLSRKFVEPQHLRKPRAVNDGLLEHS